MVAAGVRSAPPKPKKSVKGDRKISVDDLQRGREAIDRQISSDSRLESGDDSEVPKIADRVRPDARQVPAPTVCPAGDFLRREKSRVLLDQLGAAIEVIPSGDLVGRLQQEAVARPVRLVVSPPNERHSERTISLASVGERRRGSVGIARLEGLR